jgi:hypothetical protein
VTATGRDEEIQANWHRAQDSLAAAQVLLDTGHPDVACAQEKVSRGGRQVFAARRCGWFLQRLPRGGTVITLTGLANMATRSNRTLQVTHESGFARSRARCGA